MKKPHECGYLLKCYEIHHGSEGFGVEIFAHLERMREDESVLRALLNPENFCAILEAVAVLAFDDVALAHGEQVSVH